MAQPKSRPAGEVPLDRRRNEDERSSVPAERLSL
jgi:hypothetical protein